MNAEAASPRRSRPGTWFGLGAALNLGLALLFEGIRPQHLSYDGLWSARTGVWAGLLLVDNLLVVWWYATLTRQQLLLGREERADAHSRLLVSRKPLVYTERVETREHMPYYTIRNAGGGPAVNVYYLGLADTLFGSPVSLGGLAANDARTLPVAINETLKDGQSGVSFILLAEAPYQRTTQWTPSLNIRTQEGGRHGGQVIFRTATPRTESPRLQYQSVEDYLRANADGLAEELLAFRREGGIAE